MQVPPNLKRTLGYTAAGSRIQKQEETDLPPSPLSIHNHQSGRREKNIADPWSKCEEEDEDDDHYDSQDSDRTPLPPT